MRFTRLRSLLLCVLVSGGALCASSTHAAPDVRLSEILAGPGRDWDEIGRAHV